VQICDQLMALFWLFLLETWR